MLRLVPTQPLPAEVPIRVAADDLPELRVSLMQRRLELLLMAQREDDECVADALRTQAAVHDRLLKAVGV